MDVKQAYYPESRFGGFSDMDGTVAFYNRVNALLEPSFVVLDVGCGRGAYGEDPIPFRRNLRILKGKVARVIGVDVDPQAGNNPYLDEFHRVQDDRWPLATSSVDLIVCDSVLEHVEYPKRFFAEMARVLKDGGYGCIRTSNRWGYVALLASLIPNRYHATVLSLSRHGRKGQDVFPTRYRCNTIRQLTQCLQEAGFAERVVYGFRSEPAYLAFSSLTYFLGIVYQRFAPHFLQPVLFAFGRLRKAG